MSREMSVFIGGTADGTKLAIERTTPRVVIPAYDAVDGKRFLRNTYTRRVPSIGTSSISFFAIEDMGNTEAMKFLLDHYASKGET